MENKTEHKDHKKAEEKKTEHKHSEKHHEKKEEKHHDAKHSEKHHAEKHSEKKEEKHAEHKHEHKTEHKADDKKEEKKDHKKEVKHHKTVKKDEAVARGQGLHVSKKQAMYICSFIKGKDIDRAIADLGEVIKLKKAVPFKGEIPHRKGPMMSGRYPVKASKEFINMLKALKGNSIMNGLEIEKTRISLASASWAMRPMKSGGRQGKRTNVLLVAREMEAKKK